MKKNTDELQTELENAVSIKQYLEENADLFSDQDTAAVLEAMIAKRKMKKAALARQAGMSEVYLHQILAGSRKPTRDRLICLSLGMGAELEETQELLKVSSQAALYAKSRRDAVLIYGIVNRLELNAVNDLLHEAGEEPLG